MMSSVTRPERVTPYKLPDDGTFPNSSLPLLAYQSAVDDKADDLAITFEHVFQANGWGGSWRNGMYSFRHYHSNVHEVLGIARGQTHVEFGGPRGEALELTAGDAVVIPAGVSHFHLGSSADLLVIGAYPGDGSPDLCRDSLVEREAALSRLLQVSIPTTDPIYGTSGPLTRAWT
jgi:uncharacterized protein YjlB